MTATSEAYTGLVKKVSDIEINPDFGQDLTIYITFYLNNRGWAQAARDNKPITFEGVEEGRAAWTIWDEKFVGNDVAAKELLAIRNYLDKQEEILLQESHHKLQAKAASLKAQTP